MSLRDYLFHEEPGITLYCGDNRVVLPLLDRGADLVLTDPPYGNETDYTILGDGPGRLASLVAEVVPILCTRAPCVLLTPGVANVHLYPKPAWMLAWMTPAGAGSGPWGFCCWQPILAYGRDPFLAAGLGRRPDAFVATEVSELNGHPCPKPIGVWSRIMLRGSARRSDIVLDPFCGSGTTLEAARNLNRRAIGIEIEPRYCEVAVNRLRQGVLPL
jgi:site-specific DNA-methyltransferase (adenine-specific)